VCIIRQNASTPERQNARTPERQNARRSMLNNALGVFKLGVPVFIMAYLVSIGYNITFLG
jgi:hypothetical protein